MMSSNTKPVDDPDDLDTHVMDAEDLRYAAEAVAAGAPVPLPTLDQLNEQHCQDVALQTLRCLVSTDGMTTMYELLKPETLDDLMKTLKDLIVSDGDFVRTIWDSGTLLEALNHIDAIQTYSNRQQDKPEEF